MSRGQLIGLSLLTLVIAGLAIIVAQRQASEQTPPLKLLYPKLSSRLNSVARVTVHTAGDQSVTIERRDKTWVVANRDGYPATVDKLREGLIALAQAKRVEAKTKVAKRYPRLGVEAIDKARAGSQSDAQEVRVQDQQGHELAHLIVGRTGPEGGSYVRRVGQARSWLVSKRIDFPAAATDWLVSKLVNLYSARIRNIDVHPAKGPDYKLVKSNPGASQFKFKAVPEGQQVLQPNISLVAGALTNLNLKDVLAQAKAPSSEVPWSDARYETFGGLVIDARTRLVDGKHYLKLAAHFDAQQADQDKKASDQGGKDPRSAGADKNKRHAPAEAKAKAKTLQRRFDGWVYVIPRSKAKHLSYPRDKLLQAKTPPKPKSPDKG